MHLVLSPHCPTAASPSSSVYCTSQSTGSLAVQGQGGLSWHTKDSVLLRPKEDDEGTSLDFITSHSPSRQGPR